LLAGFHPSSSPAVSALQRSQHEYAWNSKDFFGSLMLNSMLDRGGS
jgi:hypothetical protein